MIPKPLQFLLLAPLAFGPMAPRFVAIAEAVAERLQGRGDHGHIVPGVGLNRRQWGASGSTHTSARHANTMSPRYPP